MEKEIEDLDKQMKNEISDIKKKYSEMKKTIKKKYKDLEKKSTTVWTKYFGISNETGKCFCCQEEINSSTFICKLENNDQEDTIDNLRPVCEKCNTSMETKNLIDYKNEISKTKKKKKSITKDLKKEVWQYYIGQSINGKCICCQGEINMIDFFCTRVKNDLDPSLDNLRPVCSKCCKTKKDQDLSEFKDKYFGKEKDLLVF